MLPVWKVFIFFWKDRTVEQILQHCQQQNFWNKSIWCYKKKSYKVCCKKIRLIRELAKEEINGYFKTDHQSFANDVEHNVRRAVAEQGCLTELNHDESQMARETAQEMMLRTEWKDRDRKENEKLFLSGRVSFLPLGL